MIVAGAHGDARQPVLERRGAAKTLEREVRFHENLLGKIGAFVFVLCVTAGDLEHARLVPTRQLLEVRVAPLEAVGNKLRIGWLLISWLGHRCAVDSNAFHRRLSTAQSSSGPPYCPMFSLIRSIAAST